MAFSEKLPSKRYRGGYWGTVDSKRKKIWLPGTFRLKSEALYAAGEAEVTARRRASLATGTLPATVTWGDWWDTLVVDRVFQSDRALTEKSVVEKHIRPHWGDEPLNSIGRKAIQTWVNRLAAANSPAYVRSIYGVFRVSINAAMDHDPPVLLASPCVGVKLPKVPKKAKSFVAPDESAALAGQLAAEWADAEEFAFETGLRPGELAGLHADQVDPAGWLTVRTAYVHRSGKMRDRPKDGDVRVVPLSTRALQIYRRRVDGRDMRQPCGVEHFGKVKCRSDLVFRAPKGGVLDQKAFRLALLAAAEKAQLPDRTPYALRRGYGTRLGRAGVDAFELADLMGHSDLAQTRDYVQQSPDVRDRVLAALGDPAATGLRVVGQPEQRGTERGTPSDGTVPKGTGRQGRRKTS